MATATFEVRVYLRAASEELVVLGEVTCEYYQESQYGIQYPVLQKFVSYPDSRAYKIEFLKYDEENQQKYKRTIELTPSRTYNYAFYVERQEDIEASYLNVVDNSTIAEKKGYYEDDVLIVSESAVPFYFPVEHSYKMGGVIKNLAISTEQISEAQVGQYPLLILTEKGIYALQQGSGVVLYSNLIPINRDSCQDGVVQTKNGIIYIANNTLYYLVGRQGENMSFTLENAPFTNVRTEKYVTAVQNPNLYDVSELISQVDFRTYLNNAKLIYDTYKEEIIVSNTSYKYSYVYSLRNKLWHKISGTYISFSNRYALRYVTDSLSDLVDLNTEATTGIAVVHAQSSVLKLDAEGYKKIERAILRANIIPEQGKRFGLYLFASDDLLSWKLIAATQKVTSTSHIRLERVQRAYKYFIVAAGGNVSVNTNLAYMDFVVSDMIANKER